MCMLVAQGWSVCLGLRLEKITERPHSLTPTHPRPCFHIHSLHPHPRPSIHIHSYTLLCLGHHAVTLQTLTYPEILSLAVTPTPKNPAHHAHPLQPRPSRPPLATPPITPLFTNAHHVSSHPPRLLTPTTPSSHPSRPPHIRTITDTSDDAHVISNAEEEEWCEPHTTATPVTLQRNFSGQ